MDFSAADLQTRLTMAQANDATVDSLAQLVSDESADVRRAVALNPNASEDILRQVGAEFPEEVLQNPIFGILMLENPASSFVYLSKARSAVTSPEALATFGRSTEEDILIAVGGNPSTPAYVLTDIVENPPSFGNYEYMEPDDYYRIFSAIAQNENTPVAVIRKIYEDWSIAERAIAQNPNTPVDILEALSNWHNNQMQLALIKNPALPSHLVGRLAIEKDQQIQLAAQTHPNKPQNIKELIAFAQESPAVASNLLEQLATDNRAYVRSLVAKHPHTPTTALEQLARDKDQKIAYTATYNPNANEAVLEQYAACLIHQYSIVSRSNKSAVYRAAAQLGSHPKITSKVLTLLMRDIPSLERELAKMETVPVTTLIEIAKRHCDIDVHRELARNPAMPAEGLSRLFMTLTQNYNERSISSCLAHIAKHPNLSELLFAGLIRMPNALEALAYNPNLTENMRDQLIATGNIRTLRNLAISSHTPPNVLLRLMGEAAGVRNTLAKNENLPPALIETLADDPEPQVRISLMQRPALPVTVLQKLSQDEFPQVCALVAAHHETPLETLEKLVQHPEEMVRGSIARNPNATPLMLLAIADEDNVKIRALLALRPDLSEAIIQVLFRKTAIELPIEIVKAKRDKAEAEEHNRNIGFSFTIISDGKPVQSQVYNEYEERVRRGEPHEKMVMARIAEHPNTPQHLRDRIRADYGI